MYLVRARTRSGKVEEAEHQVEGALSSKRAELAKGKASRPEWQGEDGPPEPCEDGGHRQTFARLSRTRATSKTGGEEERPGSRYGTLASIVEGSNNGDVFVQI